jgi:hypothetical protein
MAMVNTKRRIVTALTTLIVIGSAAFYVLAQPASEAKKSSTPLVMGKRHTLAATLETVQWGSRPERAAEAHRRLGGHRRGRDDDALARQGPARDHDGRDRRAAPRESGRRAALDDGPDLRQHRIVKIVPKVFGFNFNLPGKDFPTIGARAPEMPDGFIKFFTLDLKKRQAEFKPGITLDLRPFPGTLALGIDPNDPSPRKGGSTNPMAPVSTLRPWKNGWNMDINEL